MKIQDIRRHWTLNEIFPPYGFGATGGMDTADQVQVFADGAWIIYWLDDENDGDPGTAHWVNGPLAVDRGNTVIPPGQGIFFNNRDAPRSVLAYGEIRKTTSSVRLRPATTLSAAATPSINPPTAPSAAP